MPLIAMPTVSVAAIGFFVNRIYHNQDVALGKPGQAWRARIRLVHEGRATTLMVI